MDRTGLTSEMSFDMPDMRGLSAGSHAAPVRGSAWARTVDGGYSCISLDPCNQRGRTTLPTADSQQPIANRPWLIAHGHTHRQNRTASSAPALESESGSLVPEVPQDDGMPMKGREMTYRKESSSRATDGVSNQSCPLHG
jgi:hypothetical protein